MTTVKRSVGQASTKAPPIVMVLAAIALAFLIIPLVGLFVETPWGQLPELLTTPTAIEALRLSLITSMLAAAVATVLGVPLAWVLARKQFTGQRIMRGIVLLPLVLPPVVGGVTLLTAFGRRGLVGQYLYDWFGIQLPFSTAGVVMAEAFVAMPFLVITVEGALRSIDTRFEQAARTLGASPRTVLFRVTLPMISASLIAGIVLAWARALGEFGATITFAGNFPGVTQTLPLAVYSALEVSREEAIALSLVLLAVSLTVLVSLRGRFLGSRS
ncbi:MAG: ABC transporter permease [Candidatus Nanopelagicales bacterium]|jgi:molybdate transport system permease protein|nr:ABC transporter permease [Candidatus Nanopelagicales bacterium]NKB91334.1 molybdate ABC transporter permease subunit [Candidatus Nanopelagicales bacterium]